MMIYFALAIFVIIAALVTILCAAMYAINKMHDEYLDCDDTFRDDD